MKRDILITESTNSDFENVDQLDTASLIELINNQNRLIPQAIEQVTPTIIKVVDAIAERYKKGGRLIYIGAGSSGRIGILDAVELTPTYNVSPKRVFGLIAGGKEAMFRAIEGAEDSEKEAVEELRRIELNGLDSLVAIAASGKTPYCKAAIEYGNEMGALTVAITNNNKSEMEKIADLSIVPIVGPEVISGSTRMKAGTAQKIVVNTISTALMIRLGKVYKNYMVNVQATNEKLLCRSINIIQKVTNLDYEKAKELFIKSEYNVACAIVMHETKSTIEEAKSALDLCEDCVREAIKMVFAQRA